MGKDDIKLGVCRAVKKMPQGRAIKRVRLFGSYLHGNATDKSDVDLLIDLDENVPVGLFALYDIIEAFSQVLGTEVDVVTPEGLSRYIREQVLREAETLYER